MATTSDAEKLFKRLDVELFENIEDQYFQEPREFRSLIQVLKVLNDRVEQINYSNDSAGDLQSVLKEHNPGQLHLQQQLDIVNKVIEEVVTFQHGGLNHSVDTMGEVVKEYTSGRTDIQALRKALAETQSVLTAKKDKKTSLRELWLRKVELQESLRMVRDLEELKNTPLKVQRLMQQKKYYTTVQCLTSAVSKMFGEDLVAVGALTIVREKIMDLKEVLLESCVTELKEVVIGSVPELMVKDDEGDSESEDQVSDSRSDSAMSYLHDDRSTISFRPSVTSQASPSHPSPSADFSFYQLTESAGNSNGAGSNIWSLELKDVDESAEATLLDPSTSGPLFIRLLVKTIHVLQCEDDVERMILESLYQSFIDSVLLRFKEVAQARLSSVLERRGSFSSDEEELELHGKLFARYAGGLLDALLGLQQRLLYVCRLLAVSKELRTNSNSRATTAKESTRKLVLELWHDLEDVVIRELRIHFLEMDVEQISDRPTSVQPLANPRSGGVAPAPSRPQAKDPHRRRSTMDGAEGLDEDEDRKIFESRLVFRPSAKHAARLFKKVVSYSVKYQRILKDNALEENAPHPSMHGSAPGALSSGVVGLGGQNKVLAMVQVFLESELIPVIQSAANETMRDLQLNTDLFQPTSAHTESWQAGNTASEMAWPLCEGLCKYWVQLFQHRAMVTVVLDRLLRGFAMATREARDGIAFSFTSAEGTLNKEVCKYMRSDALYNAYRQRVFTGKRSLEDAIHGSIDAQTTHAANAEGMQGVQDDHALLQAYVREITGLWGAAYWDLASAQHPASAQKVLKPSSSLVSLSCLSYSADWLVRKMISLCNYTTRQGAGVLLQGILLGPSTAAAGGGGGASPLSPRASVSYNKSLRAELYESKHQLANAALEALRDVTRCSDETLAILRAETQLLCFYFMAKLASTPFLPASGNVAPSSADSSAGRTGGLEEQVLATFAQQLTAYIQAIQVSLSPFALPIILGPVAALVPRLLTRAIISQYGHYNAGVAQSMSAAWKTRLLRLVVSAQQQLSLALQTGLAIHAELAEPRRHILDVLTLGFEALRKLISAMEISSVELRSFLQKNIGDYARNEIKFLFSRTTDRSADWTLEDALRMHDQVMKDRAAKSTAPTVAHA